MARQDISYDYEDFGMTAEELQAKYDREHPAYTNLAYNDMLAKANDAEAQPSYWAWVVQQIAKDDDEIPGNDEQGNTLSEPFASTQKGEIVPMDNIDMFAGYLVAWHNRKVAVCQQLLEVPDGISMEVVLNPSAPAEDIILTGDAHKAFRAGVLSALSELGNLPFVAIPVEDQSQAKGEAANG